MLLTYFSSSVSEKTSLAGTYFEFMGRASKTHQGGAKVLPKALSSMTAKKIRSSSTIYWSSTLRPCQLKPHFTSGLAG